MSSWLAQSVEITLTQAPYASEEPKEIVKTPKHTVTKVPETFLSCIRPSFFSKWRLHNHSKVSLPFPPVVRTATLRDKVLRFGSSLTSQLPRKEKTTTSSPWNMFSQGQSKEHIRTLRAQVFSAEPKEQKQVKEIPKPSMVSSHLESLSQEPSKIPESRLFSPKQMQKSKNSDSHRKPTAIRQEKQELRNHIRLADHSLDQEKEEKERQGRHQQPRKEKVHAQRIVPVLQPPTLGIFSLSYLLTKQGILSDFSAYAFYKDCLEDTQRELEACHQARLEHLHQAIQREDMLKYWGSLAQLVEWISPWINIGIGVAALAAGGGIFACCALFAGLITLVLNILEYINGWEYLARRLPGKDLDKKNKILRFAKYALIGLSFLLSLASLRIEQIGFSPLVDGILKALPPGLEGGVAALRGAMLWLGSKLYRVRARTIELEAEIDLLNWERDNYLSRAEELLSDLQNAFESLAQTLQLHKEADNVFIHSLN